MASVAEHQRRDRYSRHCILHASHHHDSRAQRRPALVCALLGHRVQGRIQHQTHTLYLATALQLRALPY